MYLGIDVGGTKTLVAALDQHGAIVEQLKFPTPKDYSDFLGKLPWALARLETRDFHAAGVGIPATIIDRKKGVGVEFSNLPWKNVTIQKDIEKAVGLPTAMENDTKLAGLSEAMLVKHEFQKVLYITISTGIGTALIVNQKIDTNFGDGGGATIEIEHEGKMASWESFASGSAIVRRFGKRAEDIHDAKTWNVIAHDIAIGLIDVIAMTQPELVVIGGGAGRYLDRFIKPLNQHLRRFENPLLHLPPIRPAGRPELAVVYGCYDLAKEIYG